MRDVHATALVATAIAVCSCAASAQSIVETPFLPDTTLQRTDLIPPIPPVVRVSRIIRGQGVFHLDNGFISQGIPEGPTGSIELALSASDGSNLVDQDLGYRFHLVDGKLPHRLGKLPDGAWPGHQGAYEFWISFGWDDGQSWKQEPFSFRMYLTAVDRAGNESKPSNTIEVSDAGNNESTYAYEENRSPGSYVTRFDPLQGSWSGKDVDGKPVALSISRHQFKLASGEDMIEGFAQVWNDKDKVPQMAVDTGAGKELTGPYELNGNRLKLWLQRPGETKYYNLRKRKD